MDHLLVEERDTYPIYVINHVTFCPTDENDERENVKYGKCA
jgi:hypothetical protein